MNDRRFHQLLDYFGLSRRGYRRVRKGVKKRLSRHMADLGCHDMAGYLAELAADEEARRTCEHLLTVSISRFFRDRKLWEVLQDDILCRLIERSRPKISVWVAACASGEEVYSLRIIWEELKAAYLDLPDMQILAGDLNPRYLERARAGVYKPSSLKELPRKHRYRYFHELPQKNRYAVKARLKKGIVWENRDFLNGPPDGPFDLILLRNALLTYYSDARKKPALKRAVDALSEGGFLIIGSHEKMPSESRMMLPTASLSYVFKKGQADPRLPASYQT